MTTTNPNMLLIFMRYPEKGKVKTRLARSVGEEKALEVYKALLDHTFEMANMAAADKAVFMVDQVREYQPMVQYHFPIFLQRGSDLGERMQKAFEQAFEQGYQKVVIMGSDCPGITEDILNEAFFQLGDKDAVIGPAEDGGYYLLGLKKMIPELFSNKTWSTENVMLDTLIDLQNAEATYAFLPTLRDIDTVDDLAFFGDFRSIALGE